MKSQHPMHRLLQGEVGSGKTIVALRALLAVVDTGGQGALLAPTEVLAAQHFRSISATLGDLASAGMLGGSDRATRVVLLTGSTPAASRREILAQIKDGSAGIVIGTHALLSEGVDFADLGLIVVDEQHRFGVEQRDALKLKAQLPPHLLVMTATPIPRTVAMTVFGDLDISTLTELPKGRSPIATHVINEVAKPHYVERAWERIREEVGKGAQGYVVAPRIESAEKEAGAAEQAEAGAEVGTHSHSVESLYEYLSSGPLSMLRVGLLHGKLSSDEKDRIMRTFSNGDIDCLVATTVIEVGVDVPNATVMVIADADRFGISQLHQLRGRVGRGSKPGLCLLLTKVDEESSAMERLNAVAQSLDGFELARVDLDQRREGDVLGTAQSGTRSQLRLLRVLRDEKIIEQTRKIADEIISSDPELVEYSALREELAKLERDERADFIEKA
jgi:ATP-dependent DNA helicase RecG